MASSRALLSHVQAARSKARRAPSSTNVDHAQGAVNELTPAELNSMRRRHHVERGSMHRLRRGRRMRRAIASGDRARVDSLLARHAERSPTAQLGKSLARLRDPLAEHARLCPDAADINEAIVLPAAGTKTHPCGWQASNPDRWVGENDPSKPPPGTDWHWVLRQWYKGEHADIQPVAVIDRRPSKGAPIRRLLGYLIRLVLRRWERRIDG